jgi:hypothetical protein
VTLSKHRASLTKALSNTSCNCIIEESLIINWITRKLIDCNERYWQKFRATGWHGSPLGILRNPDQPAQSLYDSISKTTISHRISFIDHWMWISQFSLLAALESHERIKSCHETKVIEKNRIAHLNHNHNLDRLYLNFISWMQIRPYVTSCQRKYRMFHDMLASRAMGIAVLNYWYVEKLHIVSESFHKNHFPIYLSIGNGMFSWSSDRSWR